VYTVVPDKYICESFPERHVSVLAVQQLPEPPKVLPYCYSSTGGTFFHCSIHTIEKTFNASRFRTGIGIERIFGDDEIQHHWSVAAGYTDLENNPIRVHEQKRFQTPLQHIDEMKANANARMKELELMAGGDSALFTDRFFELSHTGKEEHTAVLQRRPEKLFFHRERVSLLISTMMLKR
jgi:hypothetical protein